MRLRFSVLIFSIANPALGNLIGNSDSLFPRVLEDDPAPMKREALALDNLDHQPERRQPSQCESQCSWAAATGSCTTPSCDCQVISSAGENKLSNCYNCATKHNVTYANDLQSVANECGFSITAKTATATHSASATSFPCESQCAWADAGDSCNDLQCDCQVIEHAGQSAFTKCLNCEESHNKTYASILISISSECGFSFSTTTTASHHLASSTVRTSSSAPSNTSTPLASMDSPSSSSPAVGVIAGAVVGAIIVIGAIIAVVWYFMKKRNNRNKSGGYSEIPPERLEDYRPGRQTYNNNRFEMTPLHY